MGNKKRVQSPFVCTGRTTIFVNGSHTFEPDDPKACDDILNKLNPKRGNYWKRKIIKKS